MRHRDRLREHARRDQYNGTTGVYSPEVRDELLDCSPGLRADLDALLEHQFRGVFTRIRSRPINDGVRDDVNRAHGVGRFFNAHPSHGQPQVTRGQSRGARSTIDAEGFPDLGPALPGVDPHLDAQRRESGAWNRNVVEPQQRA